MRVRGFAFFKNQIIGYALNMNTFLSWHEILLLESLRTPPAYLKMMSGICGIDVRSIVEIGVFKGRSSLQFRALFPEATLYLIDPWKLYDDYLSHEAGPISKNAIDYESAYKTVCKLFENDPKVNILRKFSIEALGDVPDGIDLIFIDGNHDYIQVKQDIQYWSTKIRPGGIISGHDYNDLFPGVIQAVDEFFPHGVKVGLDDTWFFRKTL